MAERKESAIVYLDILGSDVKMFVRKAFLETTVNKCATALPMVTVIHSLANAYVIWDGWDKPVTKCAQQENSDQDVFILVRARIKRLVILCLGVVAACQVIMGRVANCDVPMAHTEPIAEKHVIV